MDWVAIGAVAAVVLTATTVLLNALGILEKAGSLIAKIWATLFGGKAASGHPPKRTLVVIQPQPHVLWWHMGSTGGQQPRPLMQISADLRVTNIWNSDIRIAGAAIRFRQRLVFRRLERGDALVKDLRSQYSGNYPIPPNAMTRVGAHFMLDRPARKVGKYLVADLALVDQFNNYHWLRSLRFAYH